MWAKISELWFQTHVTVSFLYAILCVLTCTTRNWRWYKDILPIEWLLYYLRYLFSGLELYARYNQKVMDPNMHCNLFPIPHLCALTLITRKLQAVYGHSTYQMTGLLLEMSILCLRAVCEIWLVSYGSKHTFQSLSNKPFVCTYLYNLKTIGRIWAFYVSHNCTTFRDTLWVV